MKKLITLIVVICLLFGGTIVYLNNMQSAKIDTAGGYINEAVEDQDEDIYKGIYAMYDPDMAVMTIDGNEVTWSEYFYWFYNYASQVEQMMLYYPLYYGTEIGWNDVYDPTTGITYYDLPADTAESQMKTFVELGRFAEENGYTFNKESEAKYQEQLKETIAEAGYTTEEELFEALQDIYVTRDVYDRQTKSTIFAEQCYKEKYGENASNVSDEDAVLFLQDKNCSNVLHILIGKNDPETNEPIDAEAYAEKAAIAEEIFSKINEIEDPQEKIEAFKTYQEQYNEDGNTQYQYSTGTMDLTFEEKVLELGEYEVGVVETQYGTHIILKLPLDPDFIIYELQQTAREAFADEDMNSALIKLIENSKIEYKNGFEVPDLRKYF